MISVLNPSVEAQDLRVPTGQCLGATSSEAGSLKPPGKAEPVPSSCRHDGEPVAHM